MPYCAGGFDFPTSAGTHVVVDDLPFEEVLGVIMIGGNRPEVGTLVTSLPGPGVFMSFTGRDMNGATRSFCLSPHGASAVSGYGGFRGGEVPITVPADGVDPTVIDYRASGITLLPHGFSLNVSHAASGRRPIHYIAFGPEEFVIETHVVQRLMDGDTVTVPFVPSTQLCLSTSYSLLPDLDDPDTVGEGQVSGQVWMSMSSNHWPQGADQVLDWLAVLTFNQYVAGSPIGRQGFIGSFVFDGSSSPDTYQTMHVLSDLGPVYIEGFRRHRPTSLGSSEMADGGGGSITHATCLIWNGNGWGGHAGTVHTVPAPPAPGVDPFGDWRAILFTSNNGSSGSAGDTQLRACYGILGEAADGSTYQGCVGFGADGSFYQSVEECACNVSVGGVDSSVGELDGEEFTLTTEKGTGYSGKGQYHGWGEPEETPTAMQRRRYVTRLP